MSLISVSAATPKNVERHNRHLHEEIASLNRLLIVERARTKNLQDLARSLYDHVDLLQNSLNFAEGSMAPHAGWLVRLLRRLGLG